MKRRGTVERNDALRDKVHGLIQEGRTISQIADVLVLDGASRAAIGRYVRRYKTTLRRLEAEASGRSSGPEIVLPPGVQARIGEFHALHLKLGRRGVAVKEAALRTYLSQLPAKQRPRGVSDERINIIKAKLLGLTPEDL